MKSLKEIRKHYNLTQKEMGDIIGISSRAYREKETNKSPFTQIEIIKIISIFELKPNDAYDIFYLSGLSLYKNSNTINIKEIKNRLSCSIK